MLDNIISNCRNKKAIFRNNKLQMVSCGHCPDCLNRRTQLNCLMLSAEQVEHTYNILITLRYDEYHVPRAYLVDDTNSSGMLAIDVTKRPLIKYYNRPLNRTLKTYNQVICKIPHSFDELLFQKFYEKTDITPKTAPKCKFRNLRFLSKEDLQNFIKRLRKAVAKISDESLRLFACGEYGPQTFRPHYHISLLFSDPKIAKFIRILVAQCWPYGKITDKDVEFTDNSPHVANYVASYLNAFSRVPAFLSHSEIRPFTTHSIYLGRKNIKALRDYVYKSPSRLLDSNCFYLNGQNTTIYPTKTICDTLFPRCYNYDAQDNTTRTQLYTCYSWLVEKYQTTSPTELTREILSDKQPDILVRKLLKYLDIYHSKAKQESVKENIIYLASPIYYCDHFALKFDTPLVSFSRIYTTILRSKHFLKFCCSNYLPSKVISLIDEFYKLRQLRQLQETDAAIDELLELYPDADTSIFDFSPAYFQDAFKDYFLNTSKSYFSDDKTLDDLNKQYNDTYNKHPYIRLLNLKKDENYNRKVKHKEYNDANLIFLDL